MVTISIPLSDDGLARLRAEAGRAGLTPEEFLGREVEQLLARPDEAFRQVADHVLRKNADLYRRLA